MSTAAKRLSFEAQGILEAAERDKRPLTADERVYVNDLLDRAKDHHNLAKQLHELDPGLGPGMEFSVSQGSSTGGGSPGAAFVNSQGYKAIRDSGSRGQSWTSGAVDVGMLTKPRSTDPVGVRARRR